MITFLWPLAFVLLPLPFVARRFLKPVDPGLGGSLKVPFFAALRQQAGQGNTAQKAPVWKLLFASLIWALLVTALARPAYVGPEIPLPAEGRDVMMAIDLSGSMDERDFAVNGRPTTRLGVVKEAADDFVERREGDRVGLVLFSDRAYLQAPLTFDRDVVRQLLDQAQVGLTGQKTAIGDAIAVSIKRLKDRPEEGRVLVLLTDGANNEGVMDPIKAARLAQELGIRIYTIGVGSGYSRDLDEGALRQIANLTGGEYFRATDVQGLAQIYRAIDRLEPVSGDPLHVRPEVALYYWPAAAALILAGLFVLMTLWPSLSRGLSFNRKHPQGVQS
ncbi:BatB protein [Ruegeria sp. ANG-R]|uniref:vWA domain-containing protein n=1 Tax=Ruegeria sp. ANG-R TaxID=1577903 RepID=UPI00058041DD|nr:VWA domain-containing protein [Ruegeria sp. ANG-R]KIC39098.1 BatB protein [Ruegeria sp. ANG-R]